MKKKIQLYFIMKKTRMNYYTIKGVFKLIKKEDDINKVIDYIKKYENSITDHQLRQYIEELILNY